MLSDVLFIFQLIDKMNEAEGPANFATWTRPNEFIIACALVATHTTSFFAAGYRLRRVTADLGVDGSFTSLGVTVASSFVYTLWLVDFGGNFGRLLYAHFFLSCAVFAVNVIDLFFIFMLPHFRRQVWLVAAVATVVQYLILVSNFSVLTGDLSFGDSVLNFLTHHYTSRLAKVQAVVIGFFTFSATLYRTVATAPHYKSWDFGDSLNLIKTPAATADMEWFSNIVVAVVCFASGTFPTLCYMVVFFGDDTPTFSRFAVLMYVSLLSLRFWVQARATQVSMFIFASMVGLVVDCAVITDTLLWNEGYVLHARGNVETTVILSTASGSALVSVLCLTHSATTYAKSQVIKRKTTKDI